MPFTTSNVTIVLIHGGASSSRMYRTAIPLLNDRGYKNIICPDLPGHGERGTSTGPFTFTRSTTILEQLLTDLRSQNAERKVLLVGVSLGGQAVLRYLTHTTNPALVDAALVSGVSIHPPDERATWDMPRLPTDDKVWMDIIMEDVARMGGMEVAQALQKESFGFALDVPVRSELPPILVVIGEHDFAMAKRDFEELYQSLGDEKQGGNGRCEKLVMQGAWHNHPIDVPEAFVDVVADWAEKAFSD